MKPPGTRNVLPVDEPDAFSASWLVRLMIREIFDKKKITGPHGVFPWR
jgi:hypothetical protein